MALCELCELGAKCFIVFLCGESTTNTLISSGCVEVSLCRHQQQRHYFFYALQFVQLLWEVIQCKVASHEVACICSFILLVTLSQTHLLCCYCVVSPAAFVCHHNTFLIYSSLRNRTVRRFSIVSHLSVSVSFVFCLVLGLSGFITFLHSTSGKLHTAYVHPFF